jgi:hypothetical protein
LRRITPPTIASALPNKTSGVMIGVSSRETWMSASNGFQERDRRDLVRLIPGTALSAGAFQPADLVLEIGGRFGKQRELPSADRPGSLQGLAWRRRPGTPDRGRPPRRPSAADRPSTGKNSNSAALHSVATVVFLRSRINHCPKTTFYDSPHQR